MIEQAPHGHFTTHFDEPSIDFSATRDQDHRDDAGGVAPIAAPIPAGRSALLPMLHLVQSVEGRVTPAGIEACADILGITAADVSGVATFYTMYKRRPIGEYHVGVCTTALCAIMGGDEVYAKLQDHLGIGNDETTRRRQDHLGARGVQRSLRLRAGDDGQLGVLRQYDAGAGDGASSTRYGGVPVQSTRGAGSAPGRKPSGCSPASPTIAPTRARPLSDRRCSGLNIARERGWTAPRSART